jgi:hypothetical protein
MNRTTALRLLVSLATIFAANRLGFLPQLRGL